MCKYLPLHQMLMNLNHHYSPWDPHPPHPPCPHHMPKPPSSSSSSCHCHLHHLSCHELQHPHLSQGDHGSHCQPHSEMRRVCGHWQEGLGLQPEFPLQPCRLALVWGDS